LSLIAAAKCKNNLIPNTQHLLDCVGHQLRFPSKISSCTLLVGQPNHLKSIGWINPFGRAILSARHSSCLGF
jgi:hypothetical protein